MKKLERSYDVLVVGGGPAGWVAAVAAARNRARTLLIERYGFLGGWATVALVGPFMKYATPHEQIIEGIFKEFCDRMAKIGGMHGPTFDPEKYKRIALEMVLESDADLLLHASFMGCEVQRDRIDKALVLVKEGLRDFSARVFIDATGDGDVAAAAGAPFEVGRPKDALTQAMTLMFQVAGVDMAKVERYYLESGDEFLRWGDEKGENYFTTGVLSRAGFFSALRKAQQEGRVDKSIKYLFFISQPLPGTVVFNTTNVLQLGGLDSESLTHAEVIARRQVWQVMDLLRELPGFEDAYLVQTAAQIGVRETRRIMGEYVFTGDDVQRGSKFPDVIARGNYGIDIHDPKGEEGDQITEMPEGLTYDIPYRSLVPLKVENLLVAGRCVSATHEGQSAIRIQPICMAMGEAAGTAAALCVRTNSTPRRLDVSLLQKQLRRQGANLGKSYAAS
jgi:hypothetical protein